MGNPEEHIEHFTDEQRHVVWELIDTSRRLYDGMIDYYGAEAVHEVEAQAKIEAEARAEAENRAKTDAKSKSESKKTLGEAALAVTEIDYESLGELGKRFKETVSMANEYATMDDSPLASLESPIHEKEKAKEREQEITINPKQLKETEKILDCILDCGGEISGDYAKGPVATIRETTQISKDTWGGLRPKLRDLGVITFHKAHAKHTDRVSLELENINVIEDMIAAGKLSEELAEPIKELKLQKLEEEASMVIEEAAETLSFDEVPEDDLLTNIE